MPCCRSSCCWPASVRSSGASLGSRARIAPGLSRDWPPSAGGPSEPMLRRCPPMRLGAAFWEAKNASIPPTLSPGSSSARASLAASRDASWAPVRSCRAASLCSRLSAVSLAAAARPARPVPTSRASMSASNSLTPYFCFVVRGRRLAVGRLRATLGPRLAPDRSRGLGITIRPISSPPLASRQWACLHRYTAQSCPPR